MSPHNGRYLLDEDHEPYPCHDLMVWARAMESCRGVARTDLPNGYRVSTIFLGVDHNFAGQGAPVLFETMVFPGGLHQRRYCTWAQAQAGHAEIVEKVAPCAPLPGVMVN